MEPEAKNQPTEKEPLVTIHTGDEPAAEPHEHHAGHEEHHAKHHRVRKFLLFLLVLILIAGAAVAGYFLRDSQKGSNDDQTTSQTPEPEPQPEPTPEVQWETYTSDFSGLKFDYPEGWQVETNNRQTSYSDGSSWTTYFTNLKLPNGALVRLIQNMSQLGGACDPSSESNVVIHKEAESQFISRSDYGGEITERKTNVLSYSSPQVGFGLKLAIFDGPFDQEINGCQAFSAFTGWMPDSPRDTITFFYAGMIDMDGLGDTRTDGQRPSDEYYADVVKVLASLRRAE